VPVLLGACKTEQRLHVVFIGVERAERGEVVGARAAFSDNVCSRSPGKFGPSEFDGEDIGNHARVPSVSVGERMNFRNDLVMKAEEAFVHGERSMSQPISSIPSNSGIRFKISCGSQPMFSSCLR